MSDIIKNREIVLKDSAVIQESFNGVESNVNVFWYLEKVDNNVYPYEENHVVDYILGVYSHIDNYTSEIANDFPQDKIQYFMIHEPNFKYYPDPENIQVNIMLRNVYTSEKLANNTFNKSTRFTGNYNFNKIASLNKSDYEKFNGIPSAKLQDIIDIIGDNRAISLCVDTPYFTSTDTNTLLSDTCYLYDETYQVILSLTYPNGMDVVIPVNVTSDITGSVDAAVGVTPVDITGEIGSALKVESDITGSVDSAVAVTPIDISGTVDNAIEATPVDITGTVDSAIAVTPTDITGSMDAAVGVTPTDISGTIDNAIEVTPIDITGSVDSAVAVTPNDITGTVDAAVGVTPTDISGSLEVNQELTNIINGTIEVAVAVTPVDITGEISVAIDAEIDDKDITGNFVISKKNAYIWNDPYGQSENKNIVSDIINGNMGVSDKDLPKNLKYYSANNVSNYDTITEYPQENLNDIKMILDYNENIDAISAFDSCEKLTSLDLSELDTSNVTSMGAMFSYCKALATLDVSNFNTSKVTNMNEIFDNCMSLTTIGNISNWDTSKVTTMKRMFNNCNALTTLDVSNFDTSKVTDMTNMFFNCNRLTNLTLNFDMSSITDSSKVSNMLNSCNHLTTGNIRFYNVRKSVFTDRATFINKISGSGINSNIITVEFIDDTKSLVYYSRENVSYYTTITSYPQKNLNEIKGLLKINEDVSNMFSHCAKLTTLDVSDFDTSNVTNMNGMFSGCNALTTLDVSNFDTSNVTNMNGMFSGCAKLTALDVSNFDTSNVTDMRNMFAGCTKLTNLTLNFDMSSITAKNKVQYMFNNAMYECIITSGNIRFYNVRRSVFANRTTFINAIGGSDISDSILTVEFID